MHDEVGRIRPIERDEFDPLRPGVTIARIAARQHGTISLTQLICLGLSRSAVGRRVASGYLHAVHGGVYSVGHTLLTREGRWIAGLLAIGEGSKLSHFAAAAHLGLIKDAGRRIDVTTSNRNGRARPGVTVHRVRVLHLDDTAVHRGIPTTSIPRTVLDLAATAGRRTAERALEEAFSQDRCDLSAFDELLSRGRGRRGATTLRAIMNELTLGTTLTLSEFEEEFLAYARRHSLPTPVCNRPLKLRGRTIRPDAAWLEHRVVVEVDGRRFHSSLPAQLRDTTRDIALREAGYDPIRLVWSQVVNDDPATLDVLRQALQLS